MGWGLADLGLGCKSVGLGRENMLENLREVRWVGELFSPEGEAVHLQAAFPADACSWPG